MILTTELQSFLDAYATAALWSSTDEEGEPLDASYTAADLAPETRTAMKADCVSFLRQNVDLIGDRIDAGHDFWMTRCGHGCGFWDGDWPKEIGRLLTRASKEFGEVDLYVHDGKIHQSPGAAILYYREPNGNYLTVFKCFWRYEGCFFFVASVAAIAGHVGSVCTSAVSDEYLATCTEVACQDVPDEWFKVFHG